MTHPIHYFIGLYKELAQHPDIDLMVYFCSDESLRLTCDSTFGKVVQWYDETILEGLPHQFLRNYSPQKSIGSFWGVINPNIIAELFKKRYDAIEIQGYVNCSVWLAIFGALFTRTPIIMKGDAYLLDKRPPIKKMIKKMIFFLLFPKVAAFLGHCSTNIDYYKYYGVSEEKIFFVPYTVDNDFFQTQAYQLIPQKEILRKKYELNPNLPTIISTSKFIPRKRVMDLLLAFAEVQNKGINAQLVLVGDGTEKGALENYIKNHKVKNVYFFGFIAQNKISEFYALADIFVMTSGRDQWGYVINEAMNFSLPIITTNMVGAVYDVVKHNENGFVYPVGDIKQLFNDLSLLIINENLRKKMGKQSLEIISKWNYKLAICGIIKALDFIKRFSRF